MRIWLPLAAAALLAMEAAPVYAERDPASGAPLPPGQQPPASPITDHFYVSAAFFYPHFTTNLRVDPSYAPPGVIGTPVNAESDLGLPAHKSLGRVEFMFRLRERSKVRLDYLEADRSGSAVLANDVVFGNQVFAAGSLTETSIDFRMFDLTYTYSFYRSGRFEVGTGLAAYFLQAQATGAVPAQFQEQTVSAAEPLPALPLDFTWVISSRFAITARAAYFKATVNNLHGWLADSAEEAQYRWNRNFALGLGFSSTRISLERKSGSSPGTLYTSITGPKAFIRFSF